MKPVPHSQAYPRERRLSDMERFIEHQFQTGKLGMVRPGYTAGTYGVTKNEVKAAIMQRHELMGADK